MQRRIAALLILSLILPFPSFGASFNPNFVISDTEATETQSFDAAGLQVFLEAQESFLATYRALDIDGFEKPANVIIYAAALRNNVSPRFLLSLLQREQSLLTDPTPSAKQLDWATGFGVCDSCSMDDPTLSKYKGFANQVESAAAGFRFFMDNEIMRRSGVETIIDGLKIIPETSATANLYNYTPHLQAQENFWRIWQRYFVRRYPSGTLASAAPAIPGTWLIRYGERRLISSNSILLSRYDSKKIIKIAANDLLAYPVGEPIKFRNYSLLRSPRGTVYLIVDDERRGISSQEVFRKIGFSKSEIEDAGWEDLNAYKEGAPITMASAYPTGALLKDPKSSGVYFVQSGIKRPLYGPELLSMYFKNRKVKKTTQTELDSFKLGDPINLQDGELVKTADSAAIYVISDGKRLPISSAEEFEKQGWKWENVAVVSERVLNLSPLGEVFESKPENVEIEAN